MKMNTSVEKCKPYKNTNMKKCAQRFKCFRSLTVVYTVSDSFPEPSNGPKQNTAIQCVSLQHVTNTTSNVNQQINIKNNQSSYRHNKNKNE